MQIRVFTNASKEMGIQEIRFINCNLQWVWLMDREISHKCIGIR